MEEFKPRPGDEVKKPETEQESELKDVVVQPNFFKRTINAFFSGYIPNENFLEEFWFNNAIPVMKDSLVNFGNKMLNNIFYGGAVSNNTSGGIKPSYGRYYTRPQNVSTAFVQPQIFNSAPDYRSIVFPNRGVALIALDEVNDALNKYSRLSVGDYIDIAIKIYAEQCKERLCYIDARGNQIALVPDHVDYKYGWIDLRNVRVIPAGGGKYTLDLPAPAPFDE